MTGVLHSCCLVTNFIGSWSSQGLAKSQGTTCELFLRQVSQTVAQHDASAGLVNALAKHKHVFS